MPRIPPGLVGAAGEYLVAAQLSLRGWLATVTIKNAPGTDVLAQHETGPMVAIQTKTKTSGPHFQLAQKDERAGRSNEWYVLVGVESGHFDSARFYVVPRPVIAAIVVSYHRWWLATPGVKGQAHNDTKRRAVRPEWVEGYRDRWDLLLAPPSDAPIMVASSALETIKQHGRPEDVALLRRTRRRAKST